MKSGLRVALSVAGLFSCFLSSRPARAEVIERVVAVVNEDAIFLSELRRRAIPFLAQAMNAATEAERLSRVEQLYRELLGHLIDEKLFLAAARKMQISVGESDVERAIAGVQQQSGLDEAQFWEAVRSQGMTEAMYRMDVRRQLTRLKVLNQRVRGRVNISEEELRDRYDEMARQARRVLRFKVAHVFMSVPESATATEVAAVRKRAAQVQATLTAENFDAAIAEHGGGDLGWLRQGDLPEMLMRTLIEMSPGQISDPVRGPQGIHIFYLRERQQGNAQLPTFDQAKPQLYREILEQAMARQEQLLLKELRRQAEITSKL